MIISFTKITKRIKTATLSILLINTLGWALITNAHGQTTPHGIAAIVNDEIITTYDLQQRAIFMMVTQRIQPTEETRKQILTQAIYNLINEKLQMQEAVKYNQDMADEEVNAQMARLIEQNGLSLQDFTAQLAANGVTMKTFRDQIRSELLWSRIISGYYGSRIRISDTQIQDTFDRLSKNADQANYRVSEIYLEARPEVGGLEGALNGAQLISEQIRQGAPFNVMAQQFSNAPTAAKGGDVGWVRTGELKPELDNAIAILQPGQLSSPIVLDGGVYLLALIEKRVIETQNLYHFKTISYNEENIKDFDALTMFFTQLRATTKTCDTLEEDIGALNKKSFTFILNDLGELNETEIRQDIRDHVSYLTEGSFSAIMNSNVGALEKKVSKTIIMICKKRLTGDGIPTLQAIEDSMLAQQEAQAARRHLRNLRRTATIVMQ